LAVVNPIIGMANFIGMKKHTMKSRDAWGMSRRVVHLSFQAAEGHIGFQSFKVSIPIIGNGSKRSRIIRLR
jgi:hypothetical protein